MRKLLAIPTVLALVGCSLFPMTTPVTSTTSSSTTSTTTTTSPTTTTVPTTTTTDPGPIRGLITPTGIPVAVDSVIASGVYRVYSTCGNLTTVRGGTPIYQTPVVLDPGHGGNRDIGSQGRNGLPEKVLNLQIAFEVQRILGERGIGAILTRVDDYATTIPTRSRLADMLGAEVLVSIHHNAPTPGPSPIPGNEVFVQSTSEDSRRLGGLLWEYTVDAMSQFDIQWTAAPDAGVLHVLNDRGGDTYGMVRIPETPAVLLELGYMSNPVEAELFATQEYLEVVSMAIADAIQAYLTTDEPGAPLTGVRNFTASPGLTGPDCVETELEETAPDPG